MIKSRQKPLGDSLHGLISLSLIAALLIGFRLASQTRELLTDISQALHTIPGLGSKLLIIVLAWYLMRLIRKRLGYWIEHSIPSRFHKQITVISEILRTLLLISLLIWIFEGWFADYGPDLPLSVQIIRQLDQAMSNISPPY